MAALATSRSTRPETRRALLWLAPTLVACVAPNPEVAAVSLANHPCTSTLDDCDDGDPCTQDSCDIPNRRCRHIAIANCCVVANDCSPPIACMTRQCVLNVCLYESIDPCLEPADAGRPEDGGPEEDASTPPDDAATPPADAETELDDAGAPDAGADLDRPIAPLDVRGGACAAAPRSDPSTRALVGGALLWLARRRRAR